MNNLTIDINSYCNEKCRFCYQELDESILPEKTIFKIIDEYPTAKTVEIGGGEPFLDPRILNLTKNIRKRGKKVNMATNASLIPNGFLDLEKQVREGIYVHVSLHASNPRLYEKIHGKNLFDKVINNTKKLSSFFNMTGISSVIYQDNFEDVPNLVNLADNLNLPIRINLVFPVGKGQDVKRLNSKQIDQLKGYLLGQKLLKPGKIESSLIHFNHCSALTKAYGIPKMGNCPLDSGDKVYVSSQGEKKACEFYDSSKLKQLTIGDERK